jgi:transitional endoplasmic reticulum ATPase
MSTIVNEVPLKVYEAYTRDVGPGIARINYDIMDTLNVKTGGVIEIMGNRTNIYKSRSVAKFFPSYAHD